MRQSLKMSEADVSTFFTRRISATTMAVVIVIVLWPVLNRFLFKPVSNGRRT